MFEKSNLVSFISSTAHRQFMQECHLFIQEFSSGEKAPVLVRSDKSKMLQEEMDKLHLLAEEYQKNFSKLPQLIKDYQTLQHRIKVNMRQLQNLQKKMEKQLDKKLSHAQLTTPAVNPLLPTSES